MTQSAALVLRISKDKTGRVEGVRNQERWGRAYAAQHWPGVEIRVYADNNLSAADDTYRPEFERFRADLAAGLIGHVWAVEQSRLERREAEWFRLAAELDAAGIGEVHTKRDGIVRVRDEVAGIKAVLAASEVRKIRKRINDRLDANAALGLPAGGRPYGYRHAVVDGQKTMVIVEDEAAIIRECAERILSGWSTTNIARDLVKRGLTGPYQRKVRDAAGHVVTADGTAAEDGGTPVTRPGRITYQSVRSWVTCAAIAGKRVHRGEIVGAGNWPAILDEATWQSVRAKLTSPRTVSTAHGGEYTHTAVPRRAARRYLLTGVGVCGVCGAPLGGAAKTIQGRSTAYYVCDPHRGGRGCTGTVAEKLEAYVAEVLLAELDKPAFIAALAADEHAARRDLLTRKLTGLEAQRADLARMWARHEVTQDEWRVARAELAGEEQRLRSALAAVPPPPSNVDISAVREAWPLMTLDEQREIIGMFIEKVTLGPAARRGAGFSPDRVSSPDTWWRGA